MEIDNGYRRVVETIAVPLSAEQWAELERAGKLGQVDPQTGERIVRHFIDYLPVGWGQGADSGMLVDSYGDPIVNVMPGLPGWGDMDDAIALAGDRLTVTYRVDADGRVLA